MQTAHDHEGDSLRVGARYRVSSAPYFTDDGRRVNYPEWTLAEGDVVQIVDGDVDADGDVLVSVKGPRGYNVLFLSVDCISAVEDEPALTAEDAHRLREALGIDETIQLVTVANLLEDLGASPLLVEMISATLLAREALDRTV